MGEYRQSWVSTIHSFDGRGKRAWTQRRKPPAAPSIALQIAGLCAWFQADALALADGDLVSTWSDSSGHQRDATQANASLQPTYHAGGFGGRLKPYITFSNHYLSVPVAGLPTGPVDFTLCTILRTTDSLANRYVLAWGNTSSAGTDLIACGLHLGNLRATTWAAGTSGTHIVTDGAAHRLTYRATGGTSASLYVDGTADTTGALAYSISNPSLILGATIGTYFLPFHGDVAEVLLYSPSLNDADQATVEGYLATKYGV